MKTIKVLKFYFCLERTRLLPKAPNFFTPLVSYFHFI